LQSTTAMCYAAGKECPPMKIARVLVMSLLMVSCFGDDEPVRDGQGKPVKKQQPDDGVIPHIEDMCKTCGMLDAPCCDGSCRAVNFVLNAERCRGNLKCTRYIDNRMVCRD